MLPTLTLRRCHTPWAPAVHRLDPRLARPASQVMPGARVAVDGTVTAGHSYVDESMLTGETSAVPKAPGDSVMGGTLNTGGTLHMRCERVDL